MFNKIALLILLLMLATAPALAQTATPTAGCTGGIDIGNLNFGGQCTSNSIDSGMKSDMYRSMATAAAQVNQLPEQIRTSGQNGQSILPNISGAVQIFGYIKWLTSVNTAQETMGKTFAPFAVNVYIVLLMIITMTSLYFLVNFIVLIIKGVIWVFNQFLKLIPFW